MISIEGRGSSSTSLSKLAEVVRSVLRLQASGDNILSVYLDTSPSRIARQAFLLSLRDLYKNLRADLTETDREIFNGVASRIENVLTDGFDSHSLGLALFASASADDVVVAPLPVRPIDEISWGVQPNLAPIQAVLDQQERIAVALFDKERARLMSVYLGSVEEQRAFEDEVPGKHRSGGWAALRQSRIARHHEDRLARHAKHTIGELIELFRRHPFDRLFLGGPPEALAVLQRHLPRPLRLRLSGTIPIELFAGDEDVVDAALAAAKLAEDRSDRDVVAELIDAGQSSHSILGVEPTLAALGDGRVDVLFVEDPLTTSPTSGWRCSTCGRLTTQAERCPTCGSTMLSPCDVGEGAVVSALEQGATINVVDGDAASLLAAHGGMGAWTRF